jgi:DNA-binding IclR family transcriptional regulator
VDNRSNELRKVDCARELGLDESVVSRRMARLVALGLIRVDDAGRIYLCGRVAPTPEVATEDSVSETLPPTVRRALESMEEGEAQA